MAQHRAKAVSLRYLAAKAAASLEEVYTHMQSSAQISLTDAIAKGMERFQKQLTCAGVVTGAAMSPTLNSSWSQTDPGRVEHFLIRMIPRPVAHKTIFDGDVVAFESPLSTSVMVRRIAALEGDVMVTSDDPTPDDEEFTIPQDHAWVLADNESLSAKDAVDSRVFGPLHLNKIIGRVIYSAKSRSDHGCIENSQQAMEADAPILEAELEIDNLFQNNQHDNNND